MAVASVLQEIGGTKGGMMAEEGEEPSRGQRTWLKTRSMVMMAVYSEGGGMMLKRHMF
jgi:hypothetical protein